MYSTLKNRAKEALKRFDIAVTRHSHLLQLERKASLKSKADTVMHLLSECPERYDSQMLTALRRSKSQLGQDIFVLCELGFKAGGYFVEFGAASGLDLSNTYLLEKEFRWTGIVAEPANRWHKDLASNRQCHIETSCVWRESSSVLTFNEVSLAEFSTIDSYSAADNHSERRTDGKKYSVNTISLEDLLDKYNAPKEVDFLSIDTEGSEFEILRNFDFNKYQFRVIACEHNYGPDRARIESLLIQNGYRRKLEEFSNWDDWYVRAE